MSDPAKAEERLAALERICLLPCEKLDDLRMAMAAYRRGRLCRPPREALKGARASL